MFPNFLDLPAEEVANKLLGCYLERQIDGQIIKVRIVEVEAYDQGDEASHAYGGKTRRNAVMFGSSGHLYVYFTYGMHYCCNIVTGSVGYGAGVLIRAVEPIGGVEIIENKRSATGPSATNGPAKLCQALSIDFALRGHDLHNFPLKLSVGYLKSEETIASSVRIGISKAQSLKRRFFIQNNLFVSR